LLVSWSRFVLPFSRSPGLYKLSVQTGISAAFETEAQVEAGRAYYLGVGTQRGAPGQDLVNAAVTGGGSGERMPATSPLMAGFAGTVLSSIDPSADAVAIERLKAP